MGIVFWEKGGEVGMKHEAHVEFNNFPEPITGSFLTNEQAEQFKNVFKDFVKVIWCKDCTYRFNDCCYNKKSNRINFGVYVADDWFCADGVYRKNNNE